MKIALIGLGTTGKIVAEYLLKEQALAMVLCRQDSPKEGKDLGEILHRPTTGIAIESTADLEEKLLRYQPDVLIDFSRPGFLSQNLAVLAKCKVNVVTAVTGYSEMETKRIKVVARNGKIGIVMAPNITYGVNVLLMMARIAAHLQMECDFEIIEENHRDKTDSPSGTAKKIATAISSTIGENGGENNPIPIHSIRSGDIIGRHKILVTGKYDQIEIAHTAFSREAYAEGAFKAAQFIHGRTGFFEMKDVYRLEKNYFKVNRSVLHYNDESFDSRSCIL
ncbi:MAG TPA: 4-hydroxy-tetrahydrodipicolinate reductase [Methylomusa anaerophila]|uniref:4-hydroxy-tetrahydrodipicolinate reductase n=1 Tax=Methylomusa anaerophila TaxID=1930071 RepID=A0A348ALL3_9FIRM|nr:4-hydroxy-tetrahydrodipicolinate reductase [Methylomusa anaerophila]BBB91961.1 4-hydroxy-tetrahydrodipicolinate reductase [Methylomusa anaerophila]HML88027.1 4-hydroxy-tetrahydrodipicolinate reductase [Methylomusa anaerophila]